MNTKQFITRLQSRDIKITLENEKLRINAPTGALTTSLTEELKTRKAEIIKYLQAKLSNSEIETIDRFGELPLSSAQLRLWFNEQLESDTSVYNIPSAYRLKGNLNIDALEKAFNKIVERHEVFRCYCQTVDGKPLLKILPKLKFELKTIDLTSLTKTEQESRVTKIIDTDLTEPFNLSLAPLFRSQILILDNQEWVLIVNLHHFIADGWSINIFRQELSLFYEGFVRHHPVDLPPLSIQYVDYAYHQNKRKEEKVFAKQLNYWQDKLRSSDFVLNLPTDKPRPKIQTYDGSNQTFIIEKKQLNSLRKLCREKSVTLFMLLLCVFLILLYKHSLQSDIIVGTAVSNRPKKELENIIGTFANNLALRTQISGDLDFDTLLARVKETTVRAYANQDLPFVELIEELNLKRDLSRTPIYQVLFILHQQNAEQSFNLTDIDCESIEKQKITARLDLILSCGDRGDELKCDLEYNTNLFEAETIQKISKQYQNLLSNIVANPQQKINQISLLEDNTIDKVILANNHLPNLSKNDRDRAEFNIEDTIIQRFERQVKLYPDKIAVETTEHKWSYQKLNDKSNSIAQNLLFELSNEPIKRQQIGILFEHGIDTIATILAVLKIGYIYVPLDANYPLERLKYIIKDGQINTLLTNNNNIDLVDRLGLENTLVMNIDEIEELPLHDKIDRDEDITINPDDIAYILYTSGSTGQPKGVMQTHRNVLHFIQSYSHNLQINPRDRISLLASINFDAAVIDIYTALLNGLTLCLYDLKFNGILPLPRWLVEKKITIYHSTPTVYRYLVQEMSLIKDTQDKMLPNLRAIVLGGEKVIKSDVEAYRRYFSDDCILINGYGSSESSFNSLYTIDRDTEIKNQRVPIGYPLPETEILLLDEEGNDNQIYGEIGIRSQYITPGYWRKPDLDREVFLIDTQDTNYRIYRTGDFGRLNGDGNLEFLGRKDFQVKIRGIRIELGEIETALDKHSQLKKAIVIAKENLEGELELVAYLIPENDRLPLSELREFLSQKLPDYAIPSAFVFLDKFPLTPNGKVNRKALAQIEIEIESEREYVAPTNETETKLLSIWQDLLAKKSLGINDNLFELGGHSLMAVKMIHLINQIFNVELSLKDLFTEPTIKQLSDRIIQKQLENLTPEQLNLFFDRIKKNQ